MGFRKLRSLWGYEKSDKPAAPKTVHIFLGFFFIVNFCLGTGFLGIPYLFYYSGYLAAIPTLLLISLVSWINATYIVECMARAQALETHRKATAKGGNASDSEPDVKSKLVDDEKPIQHPNFEITVYRKFEQTEMCEIFFNKWVKYAYLIVLTVYTFLALWSFGTVAGSAWAINIPFNSSTVKQCVQDDFLHAVIPPAPCLNSYYVCLAIFGVLVIMLSLLDLKEQALVQMFLGLLRFITVAAIVIYCIVRLIEGGSKCLMQGAYNLSEAPFLANVTLAPSYDRIVLKFDVLGWMTAIPVFTYAFILHSGLPSLMHPVRQKKYLRWLLLAMFVTAGLCYFSLGIVVPLWFKSDIQETCTLNWGELTMPSSSVQLRILSYYIILFPSLDVLSAFPLCVHTVVNNLYLLSGRDTSKKPTHKYAQYDWLFRLLMRLVAAILPVLAAFGVANLIYVLKYGGLMGFVVCFGFPTALQLRSIYVCKNRFSQTLVNVGGESSHEKEVELSGVLSRPSQDKAPLLSMLELDSKEKRALYMTPYSSKLFSHPIAVVVVGVVGLILFVLSFGSLFVHPTTEVCYSDLSDPRLYEEL